MTRDISKPIASLLSIRGHPKLIRSGGRMHLRVLRRFPGAAFLGGDTLVLTTHGRCSGLPRSTPVYYVRHDDRLYIAASFAGRDDPPNWYLNLLAHPEVTIEAAGDRGTYHARVLSPTDAARIWPQLIATYPPFARYQRRTTRTIPVIELSRVDPDGHTPQPAAHHPGEVECGQTQKSGPLFGRAEFEADVP